MNNDISKYTKLIRATLATHYKQCLRQPVAPFKYPFIVAGSQSYNNALWDWDSFFHNIALRQIVTELDPQALAQIVPHEQGCVLNFLDACSGAEGWIPIYITAGHDPATGMPANIYATNMHKPILAQHAAFLVNSLGGEAGWLRPGFERLMAFVNNYRFHHRHRCGLYFWQDDFAIGVDTDPCTYFRPPRSSGSIFLNCLMYKELCAIAYLCRCLGLDEIAAAYEGDGANLKAAVNEHCWDERDGFYYSVDLNLLPNDNVVGLHQGMPRHWDCLIQRIGVWSGFLGLWANLASPRQADRIVSEHLRNSATFNAPYGIRSLSKMEKMYQIRASGNPSSWLGPIWGIVNYLVFRGLINYGYTDDARVLAQKTVCLFGRDLERFGQLHEYYQPENGEPVMNEGFQDWNFLVLNMIAWLEGKPAAAEM